MRKSILFLALALVAGASCSSASAASAKKNKKKVQPVVATVQPVSIVTSSDSVSYAAGKSFTNGLSQFLQQQYGVSSKDSNFIEGFKAGVASAADARKKAYNAGLQIANMVQERMLPNVKELFVGTPDSVNSALLYRGFEDALSGDNHVMTDSAAEKLFSDARIAVTNKKNEAYKKENEQWLADNKTKPGVVVLPSGLQYKVLTAGTGEVAKGDDEVEVKYEGKLIDGTVFDSSYKRNPQTSTFRPSQVIKGWTEALQLMPVGSTWELYIPQDLAYGSRQAGQIKPYSTLIFKVELVAVHHNDASKTQAKSAKKATVAGKTAGKTQRKATTARRR